MHAKRLATTGYAPVSPWEPTADFSQGRPCRPVQTHDEAAGGGNRTLQRPSGKRPALAREKESISTVGHRHHVQESSNRRVRWLAHAARRRAPCKMLGSRLSRGVPQLLLRWRRAGSKSDACKFTLASLPRELMPNPSLKRSANGRPPGPGRQYGGHFCQPGPGVLPSSPA